MCSVNCVVWDDGERKGEGETRCRLILLFSKSTKGAARLNVPIRHTNRYQQYYMSSRHTYCGRVWNLIQDCDVQDVQSPEVENVQMKIYYPAGDRTWTR